MTSYPNRRYTAEEVSAIVRRALESRASTDSISYDELLETAEELNIPAERLRAAIEAQDKEGEKEAVREKVLKRRRQEFNNHLRAYLIVNGALMLVNLMASGGFHELWFVWPMVGWGIGLAFHASSTFFPTDRDIERAIHRQLRRERVRQRVMQRWASR